MMLPSEIPVTFFTDARAQFRDEQQLSPKALADRIREMVAAEKARLPWLKLARFGDRRSDKHSLRHDGNVNKISGVELDYDGGEIGFDAAVRTLKSVNLAAIVYTSPSHTPDTPRWRILAPTSHDMPPEARYQLVARINGLFGGIFADESFTLSQSYYYGQVFGAPDFRVTGLNGATIDELDSLDASAIGRRGGVYTNGHDQSGANVVPFTNGHDKTAAGSAKPNFDYGRSRFDPEERIRNIKAGHELHNNARDLASHMVSTGHRDWVIAELLEQLLTPVSDGKTLGDIQEFIRSARRKYNVPEPEEDWDSYASVEAPNPADCSIEAWLSRDIPEPDLLLGPFSTTTRAMFVADTGLGKTNFAMAVAFHMAGNKNFLHWKTLRSARVLFIDGEMSKRLLRSRIRDAARRFNGNPEGLRFLCRDDCEDMPPLNTSAGQLFIDGFIEKAGGFDFIFFDNVQALLNGDMKDEEPWQQTLPWIRDLTKRSIGQLWVHHTGHDATRSYGTKTREWQLDSVLLAEITEHFNVDIAFNLKFTKARERAPDNRTDYAPVTITLANDEWNTDDVTGKKSSKPPSPLSQKFFEALLDAISIAPIISQQSAGKVSTVDKTWWSECIRRGLLNPGSDLQTQSRNRALISKYRRELIEADWIACNGELVWSLRQV